MNQPFLFDGGGVFGGLVFFGSAGGARGSGTTGGACPGFAEPFGRGSPKITCAFAGRFRTAVGQSVGAACLLAGTLGSQIRHMPAGGFALAGTLSDGRGRSCPCKGKPTSVPIRATMARRI